MLNEFWSKISPHLPVFGATVYGNMALIFVVGSFSVGIELIRAKRDRDIKQMDIRMEEKKLAAKNNAIEK